MLSSITPLGERGRHNRFAVTASFFVAGSLAGGIAFGFLAGSLGSAVLPDRPAAIVAVLALVALVGAALDGRAGGLRLPTIRRQVDERWLDEYRGWVYGLGYGVQLGAALTTVVSSAAVYLMVLAAVGARSAVEGAVIGAVFGAIRGSSVLLARRVHTPDELRSLHRRLASRAIVSERVSVLAQGVVGVGGIVVMVGLR